MQQGWKKISPKLADSKLHGVASHAELFIVEGDSAAKAVTAVRNPEYQAVLPMQGKPINASKASRRAILEYELFVAVFEALGLYPNQAIDVSNCRFSKVILLFDPDADGIHCGALMLIFFHRVLLPLLESGRLCLARAPLYELKIKTTPQAKPETRYAYSQDEALKLIRDLELLDIPVQRTHYRGLASMRDATLAKTCINPSSRTIHRVRPEDAEAALAVFGKS